MRSWLCVTGSNYSIEGTSVRRSSPKHFFMDISGAPRTFPSRKTSQDVCQINFLLCFLTHQLADYKSIQGEGARRDRVHCKYFSCHS